jgi:hypothetical protein
MALYLGSDQIKINLDSTVYCLNMLVEQLIRLLSSDNCILKSSDGLCLVVNDTGVNKVTILSSDGYILKDLNGLRLIAKEEDE